MLRGDIPFVNADEIAQTLEPTQAGLDVGKAGRLAVQRRNDLLARRESLSIETTLSGHSAIAFMQKAKAGGYRISLAYVGIDTPELSRTRVDVRVAKGGHDVPEDAIIRRHPDSLRRLRSAIAISDTILVFDNSGQERRLLLHIEEQEVRFIADDRPSWFYDSIPEELRSQPT
jgi:predicted ABC-type ATPase